MNGSELIAAERQRQIEAEGWTPEHDDEHASGELTRAAIAYAAQEAAQVKLGTVKTCDPFNWFVHERIATLEADADRLVEALKDCQACLIQVGTTSPFIGTIMRATDKANAALAQHAKVKGSN